MEKKPYTANSLVCDLAGGAGFFFLIFGILHLTVRQHDIAGFWGWVFIAIGAVLIGLVILINASIIVKIKKEEGKLTSKTKPTRGGGFRIHADLILGLLLIAYFSPLIGTDAGVPVWLAFVSGILLAAGRVFRCFGKFISSGIKGKADKWKKRAEEMKKEHESEEA